MAKCRKYPKEKVLPDENGKCSLCGGECESEGEVFARKCSITGEGMNEGWIAEYALMYFKYEEDAIAWCKENLKKSLKEAYDEGEIYWTEWDAEHDAEYIIKDGKVVEIEQETSGDKNKALDLLKSLEIDCNMAIIGEWDCSTDEGKEGFNSMIESIEEIKSIINKNM